MPVNNTHPDYDFGLPGWLRARDVLAGEDAVKSAGEKYLPRLDSQSDEEFLAYRKRASFFNATARSAEGFVGLIFRWPPFIKMPETSHRPGVLPGPGNDVNMSARREWSGSEIKRADPKAGSITSFPRWSGEAWVTTVVY
jgi:hypothetical protein